MLYRDFLTATLQLIGVIGEGESMTAYQADKALNSLNEMVDSFNADNLMIYTTSFHEAIISSSKSGWTIGPGAEIDLPSRPNTIQSAFIRMNRSSSNPIDIPLTMLSATEWSDVRSKSVTGNYPGYLYLNGDWPVATAYLWPVPQVADTSLNILCNQTLNNAVGLDDSVDLPPAYRQALRFNLAVLLAPEFGIEATPTIQAQAYKAKQLIGNNNLSIDRLDFDDIGSGGGWYWAQSDNRI